MNNLSHEKLNSSQHYGELLWQELVAKRELASLDNIKSFIQNGANVNFRPIDAALHETPLMAAIMHSFEHVKILVESGADLELQNYNDHRALSIACVYSDFEVVEYLVSMGANYQRAVHGSTAIDWCVRSSKDKIKKLNFFFDKEVMCAYRKENGETFYSCLYPNTPLSLDTVEFLVPRIYRRYGEKYLVPPPNSLRINKTIEGQNLKDVIITLIEKEKIQNQTKLASSIEDKKIHKI